MSNYMGLDASLTGTGVVVLTDDIKQPFVQVTLSPKDDGAARLVAIETLLEKITSSLPELRMVALEGYAYGALGKLAEIGELGGILRRFFFLEKIPLTIVSPGTLKKWVSGSGATKKNKMMLSAYKKWGLEFEDDNQCDAYGLATIARALATEQKGLTKIEQEVLKTINTSSQKRC